MNRIRVQMTLSGRPLHRCPVSVEGIAEPLETDDRGHLDLELPDGRYGGVVTHRQTEHPFEVVSAPGLRRIRIDIREEERPIDHPGVIEAMPAARYVPLALLGRGGAGSVFKCRDTQLDRLVAVKILNETVAETDEQLREFLHEARSLARLEDPTLIQIYDVGIHRGRPYMVVQYVDGPNLDELVYVEGRLQPGSVAAAAVQLTRALSVIHEAGMLHRDMKPSNGLVDRAGRVRLADFGLARPLVDFADPRSRVYGTPAYMSPEQLQGAPLGPASDVYSLGATLYQLATGEMPFPAEDTVVGHLTWPPPDVRDRVPDVPADLADTLIAMMAKRPADRPSSDEIIETFAHVATSVPYRDDVAYLPRLDSSQLGMVLLTGKGPRAGTNRRPAWRPAASDEAGSSAAGSDRGVPPHTPTSGEAADDGARVTPLPVDDADQGADRLGALAPPSPSTRRRLPVTLVAALILLMVGGIAAVALVATRGQVHPPSASERDRAGGPSGSAGASTASGETASFAATEAAPASSAPTGASEGTGSTRPGADATRAGQSPEDPRPEPSPSPSASETVARTLVENEWLRRSGRAAIDVALGVEARSRLIASRPAQPEVSSRPAAGSEDDEGAAREAPTGATGSRPDDTPEVDEEAAAPSDEEQADAEVSSTHGDELGSEQRSAVTPSGPPEPGETPTAPGLQPLPAAGPTAADEAESEGRSPAQAAEDVPEERTQPVEGGVDETEDDADAESYIPVSF